MDSVLRRSSRASPALARLAPVWRAGHDRLAILVVGHVTALRDSMRAGVALAACVGMRPPILLLPVFTACIFRQEPPGDHEVTLDVYSALRIEASERSVRILLAISPTDGSRYETPGSCPIVDTDLTARLGGVAVPLVARGGKVDEAPGDDVSDNVCGAPILAIDVPPPDGASVLVLSDPALTFMCQLPDLKATRQVAVLSPGDWTWRSGQSVTMTWSPLGDLVHWSSVHVTFEHLNAANEIDDRTEASGVTFGNDLVHVTVPPLVAGSYNVALRPSPSVTCAPKRVVATVLSSWTTFAAEHAVTIAP